MKEIKIKNNGFVQHKRKDDFVTTLCPIQCEDGERQTCDADCAWFMIDNKDVFCNETYIGTIVEDLR